MTGASRSTGPENAVKPAERHDAITYALQTTRFGMWVFIAMEILFFSGALLLYTGARHMNPLAFQLGSEHLELGLASLNTAVLLTSSLTMAMTEPFLERGKVKHAAFTLLLTALLGALFFGLKCYEYHLDFLKGLMPGFRFEPSFAAPKGLYLFFSLYLLLTGLHAVHLTIGVAWCGAMVVSLAQKKPSAQASLGRVSVLGLYWHFVDIVWVFLLPLLYLVGGKG